MEGCASARRGAVTSDFSQRQARELRPEERAAREKYLLRHSPARPPTRAEIRACLIFADSLYARAVAVRCRCHDSSQHENFYSRFSLLAFDEFLT